MATESFFVSVELTEEEAIKLLKELNDENSGIKIPEEVIEETRKEEKEGEKAVLEWLKNL